MFPLAARTIPVEVTEDSLQHWYWNIAGVRYVVTCLGWLHDKLQSCQILNLYLGRSNLLMNGYLQKIVFLSWHHASLIRFYIMSWLHITYI